MADRKETPDILGDLLGAGEPAEAPEEEASKPARQPRGKTAEKQASKPAEEAREPAPAPPSGEKAKATLYFAPETIEALEAGWLQLRRLIQTERRNQISKSSIVETALLIALEDLKKKGEKSQLARRLEEQ